MKAILNSLNAHNFPIFQPILILLLSKFMVHKALSDKTYLSLGLLSPLIFVRAIYILILFYKSQKAIDSLQIKKSLYVK